MNVTPVEKLHEIFLQYPIASTDSRAIEQDSIFFALKGPNFNGNAYAADALKKGAKWAVIDEAGFAVEGQTLLVKNVLESLQELATYHRNYCKTRILAITGSNGKTTTKELITAVLSQKYQTVATQGNLNNHIGVPLTLLKINPKTEIAVVEMGANHLGEIDLLCKIAHPDFGYITNFGKAHLEGFGGLKGVIKGKSELYDHLISRGKHVFINADDPVQSEKLETYVKKIGFSTTDHRYYKIEFLGATPFVRLKAEDIEIRTQLIGSYNFSNCAAALLVGKYFNVPLDKIKKALESYVPEDNRSQIIDRNGLQIVLDAYNANPSSMQEALMNFEKLEVSPKVAVLGDMFELGTSSHVEHQGIADLVAGLKLDKVLFVGSNFSETSSIFPQFKNFEELSRFLKANPIKKGGLLIKGSRGMALERVLEVI